MECSIVHHNLFAYRDGDLQPDLKKDIEAHISECKSCKQLISGFQSIEAIIEKAKSVDPNPFSSTRIIQHIENELKSNKKERVFVLRPILVTLTVVTAIAMGFAIGKTGFDRISGDDANQNQLENLKTELFIHDFVDENKTLFVNE